jgi:hypothetical protein
METLSLHDDFPENNNIITIASPWMSTGFTPDYFHENCPPIDSYPYCDVPDNDRGYQYARSGVAYAGPDNVACFFTYDGTSWDSIPFPAGPTQAGSFRAGLVRYDDRFFAAGNVPYPGGSDIFEWEGGSSFIPAWPGQSGQGYFSDMVIYNGELVVAGYFLEAWGNPGNCIAAYDGISWRPLYTAEGPENPTAFPAVWDLLVHDGILYATGYFSHMDGEAANHVAWWDGTQWHGLGAEGIPNSMCRDPTTEPALTLTVWPNPATSRLHIRIWAVHW